MVLSGKVKESIKTALAMTIAYGIALQMDWANPYWAGFAVAFVSLSSVGQSFNKAAMRMFGTLVAAIFALTFIALFPQERWLFMLTLSAYVGFCTYMMSGPKQQYFWNVSGFVCVIICMGAGADPVNAFQTAILRTEETGLGILVYSLVSILLWPTSSRTAFLNTTRSLAADQRQLFRACSALIRGGDVADVVKQKGQVLQAQTQLNQLLDAAETDTYEVWELRRQWRLHQRYTTRLTETIGRWRESFTEPQTLEISRLFFNLEDFVAELDARFSQVELMLDDQKPEREPIAISLDMNKVGFEGLSHFERASLVVFRSRLKELEQLTRAQFEAVHALKGFGTYDLPPDPVEPPAARFLPDPDRLLGVVRVMLSMWLAFLVLIYVDSIPGSTSYLTMTAVYGMIAAAMPQAPIRKMYLPIASGVAFGSLFYLFIMPQLSNFLSLGLCLFAVTFALCYLFDAPQQKLAKIFGLAMFVSIASVNNQQSYSFMVVATNVLMFPLIFLILALTANFPKVMRPEKSFLRLLDRYFRSFDHLLSSLNRELPHSATGFDRWLRAFHLREISSIPVKLGAWAKSLDFKTIPGTSPSQVQSVLDGLQELSGRLRELIEERQTLRGHLLLRELNEDARDWRRAQQEGLKYLRSGPSEQTKETLRAKLDEIMSKLEMRIKEALDKVGEGEVSARDGENFYRLLGAYRSLSEALVVCAGSAGAVDWGRWHEERF